MPLTVNAPSFWWDPLLDKMINDARREPQSTGSYTFEKSDEPLLRDNTREDYIFPYGMKHESDPRMQYNRAMSITEGETAKDTIPYNQFPGKENINPDLLDEMRAWIARGGSARK